MKKPYKSLKLYSQSQIGAFPAAVLAAIGAASVAEAAVAGVAVGLGATALSKRGGDKMSVEFQSNKLQPVLI